MPRRRHARRLNKALLPRRTGSPTGRRWTGPCPALMLFRGTAQAQAFANLLQGIAILGGNSAPGDAHMPGYGRLDGFDAELMSPRLAGEQAVEGFVHGISPAAAEQI